MRQIMSKAGAEREGNTESEAGSRLWAVGTEPDEGLEPAHHETKTFAEVGGLTDWAIQVLQKEIISKVHFWMLLWCVTS